jgi:hypothetical protein
MYYVRTVLYEFRALNITLNMYHVEEVTSAKRQ